MPCSLIEGEKVAHFVTDRFDRIGNGKVHTQTLAAMNPSANSYEELFDVACRIGIVPSELSQIFLSMTANVACGNIDDHSRNFSFLMGKDGVWHMAPTYDFVYAIDNYAFDFYHKSTINGKDRRISRKDLLTVAQRYKVNDAEPMIDKVVEVARDYPRYAREAGINRYIADKILKDIEERSKLIDR